MSQREILSITTGRATSDGAGVSLTRVFGGAAPERVDLSLALRLPGEANPLRRGCVDQVPPQRCGTTALVA